MVPECYKEIEGLRNLAGTAAWGDEEKKVPAVSGSGDGFKTF